MLGPGELIPLHCGCAGNAEAQYLAGVGVARQRQAIVNGLRDSIKNFSSDISDVSSRDVIEMVRASLAPPVSLAACLLCLAHAGDAEALSQQYLRLDLAF